MIKYYFVTLYKRLILTIIFVISYVSSMGQSIEPISTITTAQKQPLIVDYLGEGAGSSAILGFFFLDIDTDLDGLPDFYETAPGDDLDGDGLINSVDPDDDNDGIPDAADVQPVGITSMAASYFRNGTTAATNGNTSGDYWQFLPNSIQSSGAYSGYYEHPAVYLYIDNNINNIPDILEYTIVSNTMPPFAVDKGVSTSHAILGSFEGLLGDWSYSGSPTTEEHSTGRTIFYICDDDRGSFQTPQYTNNSLYSITDIYDSTDNQVDYNIYGTTDNQSTLIPQTILGTDSDGEEFYKYRWFDEIVVNPDRELVIFASVFWSSGGSGVNTYYSKTEFNPDSASSSPTRNGATTGDNFGGSSISNWFPQFQNGSDHDRLVADVFGTGTTWAMIASSPTDGSSPVAINPVNQAWVDIYENWTPATRIIQYRAVADWFSSTAADVNTAINNRYGYDLATDSQNVIIRAKEGIQPHFMVVSPTGDPNSFIIGVEDLFGGGDRDYEDEMFYITFTNDVRVAVTKTDDFTLNQCAEDTIQYEVIIENFGGSTATNVMFNETLDTNTTLEVGSVTTTSGSITIGNTVGDIDVQVTIGNIAAGEAVTVNFNVSVNTGVFPTTTDISNQGTVSGSNFSDVLTGDPDALVHFTPTITDLSDMVDNEAPSITCPGDQMVNLESSCQFTLIDYTGLATTSDNCATTISVTQSPAIGDIVTSDTVVTLTADDGNGNTSTCTFNVIITDTVDPIIECTRDITATNDPGECGAIVNFDPPTGKYLRINTGTLTSGPSLATSGGTTNWASVAYNPDLDIYYSLRGGNTGMPFRTYDGNGNTLVTNTTGFDFRGLWWNPNTSELQGNGVAASGYRTVTLDASGYATSGGVTFVTGNNQPNNHSNGAYDYDADEIVFYHGGRLYTYDLSGNQLTDNAIVNFPEAEDGDITSRSVGYTGVTGAEIVIYSELNARVYFIDKTTATYNGMFLDMPAGAPTPNTYGFAYSNGYVFLREDATADPWISYQIVVEDFDNCSTTVAQTGGLTSGSLFPIGTSTIEYTVTDVSGNSTMCSFDITVNDNESPIAICQDITVQLDATGNGTITVADVDNGSTDACGIASLSLDITSFTLADLGANTVTLTAEDTAGNSSDCTAIVTVLDGIVLDVLGNGISIVNGDTTPDAADSTEFISVLSGGSSTSTFTIDNSAGIHVLDITDISISGSGAGAFTLGVYPTSVVAGASDTFDIVFAPATDGTFDAVVTIESNDTDENPYTFAIIGKTGIGAETFNFDGNDDYALANINSMSTDFTLEAWFKADSGANGYRAIIVWQKTGQNHETSLEVAGNGLLRLGQFDYANSSWAQVFSTTNVKDDQWHHVAAAKQGNVWTLYIDGAEEGTLTLQNNNNAFTGLTDFRIGNIQFNNGNLGEHFRGEIDEVRIWDYSLTCTEILNQMTCGLTGTEPNLLAYYDFNQGVSEGNNRLETQLLDRGPNGYHATLNNTALNGSNSNWIEPGSGVNPISCVATAPEITVEGNGQLITTGDTTPDIADGTDFGTVSTGAKTVQTFTINNVGGGTLEITGITVSGTEFSLESVLTFPVSITAGSAMDFEVAFLSNSCTASSFNGSIQIDSNDCIIGTFSYDISASVIDDVKPTVVCQNITVQLDAMGNATITASDVDNGSSDACGIASTAIDVTSFDCSDIGTNDVILTVTDANGNSDTCNVIVTVEDSMDPTAVCIDATVQLDNLGNTSIAIADFDGGSSDNCNTEVYFSNDLTISQTSFFNTNNSPGAGQSFTATVTGILKIVRIMVDRNYGNRTFNFYNGSGTGTVGSIGSPVYTETGVVLVDSNGGTIWSEVTLSTPFPVIAGNTYSFVIERFTRVYYGGDNYPGGEYIWRYDTTSGCCTWGDLAFELEFLEFNEALDLDCDDVGIQSFDITAIDSSGNMDTCAALITVEDMVQPTVVCQNITVQLDATGNAMITAADVDNGSTDACGIASTVINITSFDCSNIGTNNVELTVTDTNGNSDTCTTIVTVEDAVLPTVVCQNITVQLDATGNAMITAADVDNESTDACGIASRVIDITSFDCSNIGTNNVVLTVTDTNGNSDTCIAIVTVEDMILPTVVCQNITLQLDATGNATITAADVDNGSSDACGIASTAIDITSFDCSNIGTNNVVLTVTDTNGNSDTCTVVVTVEDMILPTVVCQDITLQLDATGNTTITATDVDNGSTDACGIASTAIDITSFDCSNIGTNNVELTVTDTNGNSDTCIAVVIVEDAVLPTVVCQNITVQLDATGNAMITATDVDNGSTDACGIASTVIDITSFDCSNIGTNNVELTVTDTNGNSDTCTAVVTVEDAVLPTVVCQNITVHLDATGNAMITATDVDNGSTDACGIASTAIDITSFDCSNIGTNNVVLTVTDSNGNSNICTAVVTVEDTIAPVVLCQNITVQLDATGNTTITATDVDNGSTDACGIASTVIDITSFDCSNIGTNNVVLTVADTNGNSDTCTAIVTVEDAIAPVVFCKDITVQLDASGNATITAADVDNGSTDACGIASRVIDINSFDCSNIGTNNVVLTVTDSNGNSDTCTAVVTVEDAIAPVVLCQNITVQLDATGNATITATDVDNGSTDACGIASRVIDITSFNCSNIGTNNVVLTVTDSNGNSDTCTAIITVEDAIAPVVFCQDITVQLDASGNATITAADVDNGSMDACRIVGLHLDRNEFDLDNVGNNSVTLTVTDASGNSSQCIANVFVVDNTPPIITLIGDDPQVIDLGLGYTELGAVTNDGSPIEIDISNFEDVVGSYIITYNSTDASGNVAAEVTRVVNVVHTDLTIEIYPNPVSDSFRVLNFRNIEGLEIYDMSGRRIHKFNQKQLEEPIPVDHLQEGIYWFRAYFIPKGSVYKKIMINH